MRRCVLCGRWVLLAFQVEGGEFVCEAARLGLGGGGRRMRGRVLCGCWARLAFPRARDRRANRFLRYTGGESQAKLLTYELFS